MLADVFKVTEELMWITLTILPIPAAVPLQIFLYVTVSQGDMVVKCKWHIASTGTSRLAPSLGATPQLTTN